MPWGDPTILREIIQQSHSIGDPRVARLFRRAAVQTGLVESAGRNLRGGDADSENWRQERASVYGPAWRRSGGPLNTRASVARFKSEFLQQYDPGERAWQVAAQVQRPREDLRGRYHDVAKEANAILSRAGGGRGAGGGGGAIDPGMLIPGIQGAQSAPMGSQGLVTLLQALGEPKQAPSSGGLPSPAFAAGPTLAGQAPSSGSGPQPKPDVAKMLELIQTQGGDVQLAPGASAMLVGGSQAAAGGRTSAGGRPGKVTVAPGANRPGVGLKPVVVSFIRQVAGLYGQPLTIGTGTNHSRMTVNGNVSDHWDGYGADVPLRGRALIRAGQDALIAAGMPAAKARRQTGGLFNVGGWQIIFNTHEGGDHTDHLHAGRRAR